MKCTIFTDDTAFNLERVGATDSGLLRDQIIAKALIELGVAIAKIPKDVAPLTCAGQSL